MAEFKWPDAKQRSRVSRTTALHLLQLLAHDAVLKDDPVQPTFALYFYFESL